MTFFVAQMTEDLGLLTGSSLFSASTGLVANLTTVGTFVNTTIKRNTGIHETSQVVLRIFGPFGGERGTLRLVRSEIADRVTLADFTLEIDVGPSVTMVFLLRGS
jgi:hypothetical protein